MSLQEKRLCAMVTKWQCRRFKYATTGSKKNDTVTQEPPVVGPQYRRFLTRTAGTEEIHYRRFLSRTAGSRVLVPAVPDDNRRHWALTRTAGSRVLVPSVPDDNRRHWALKP